MLFDELLALFKTGNLFDIGAGWKLVVEYQFELHRVDDIGLDVQQTPCRIRSSLGSRGSCLHRL